DGARLFCAAANNIVVVDAAGNVTESPAGFRADSAVIGKNDVAFAMLSRAQADLHARVACVDLDRGDVRWTRHVETVFACAVDDQGARVVVHHHVDGLDEVATWDARTGETRALLFTSTGELRAIDAAPDLSRVCAVDDRAVYVARKLGI